MEIRKEYTFSNDRQIWRLIPTESDKLVIEERNPETKEVFFNCLNINSGKKIFSELQLEEKFWVGIEAVHKDIIYFHRFLKPDMPGHKDIIAYDIDSGTILWKNEELSFLFIKDDLVYCYKSLFEGKNYFALNFKTGELIEDLGNNYSEINILMERARESQNFEKYVFPESYNSGLIDNKIIDDLIRRIKEEKVITGRIDFAIYKNLLLLNYHEVTSEGKLTNNFKAVDFESGHTLLEEILNKNSSVLIPDSFFIRGDKLFLLKEKSALVVCSIIS